MGARNTGGTASSHRALCFALVAAAAGCGGTFQSPATGGEQWFETRSMNFVVRTDAGADAARSYAEEYERIYEFFAQVAFTSTEEPAGLTDVVVFRRNDEYDEIGPPGTAGFFTRGRTLSWPSNPLIVVSAGRSHEHVQQAFQHELAHRFVAFHFPSAPTWVNEGLATFYETANIGTDSIRFGESPSVAGFSRQFGWITAGARFPRYLTELPPARLRAFQPDDFYASRLEDAEQAQSTRVLHYLGAWAQIHVLMLGSPELHRQFVTYLNTLKSGDPEPWDRIFDATSLERLDAEYQAFLKNGRTAKAELPPLKLGPIDAETRAMTAAEVHVLWARVRSPLGTAQQQKIRHDIDEAIRLAPDSADGYLLDAEWWAREKVFDKVGSSVERAVSVEPENPKALAARAWWLLSDELSKPLEKRNLKQAAQAFRELRARAKDAHGWLILAIFEAVSGNLGRGIALADRAARTNSTCWECYLIGGELAFRKGKDDIAVAALRTAAALAGENGGARLWKRFHEVEKAAEACRATGASCGPRAEPMFY